MISIYRRAAPSLLLLSLAGCAASIQPAPNVESTTDCTVVPRETNPAETRSSILYAVAELGHEAPDTARLYATNLLGEVARALRFPTPILFNVWASPDSLGVTVPVLASEVLVVIRPDGQLHRIELVQTSLVAAIDGGLQTAIRTAVESLLPPSVLGVSKDLTLYFTLTMEPTLGVIPLPGGDRRSKARPAFPVRRTVEQPVLRLALPTARFSAFPQFERRPSSGPRYPPGLKSENIEGDVTAQFVVGEDGLVVPGTIRVVEATDIGFANSVIRSLEDARFSPGLIGGCAVPVLMTNWFSFRLGP